jgi:hypothetical protein
LAGVPDGEAEEGGGEIAEGDAGEDSVEAEVSEVEVGEGGEKELDGEERGGSAEDVSGEGELAVAAIHAALEGEDGGDADDEEEVGEDEVGEGEAVPGGVVELRVDVGPVAGIVDEDHESDGEAAENVYCKDALRGGLGDGLHG